MLDAAKLEELAQLSVEELSNALGPELDTYIRKIAKSEEAKKARSDFLTFMRYLKPDPDFPDDVEKSRYDVQVFHRVLAEALEKVSRGEILRLAISMPPQMGKTEMCTKGFPAWIAGRFPERHAIIAAYNQDLAQEFGRHIVRIMESPEYRDVFPRMVLENKAQKLISFENGGAMAFIGRDGAGTGRPADLFIIDDPYKNKGDADSLATREEVWGLFTRVVNSRMRNTGAVIVIHTRWSEDDLIARLTDPKNPHYDKGVAEQWTYLNIPEIMDDEEIARILGKKVGDALWPERRSLKMLDTVRRMDPAGFSALHMGKPTPPEGAFFKVEHLRGYKQDEMPKLSKLRCYMSGDFAVSTKKGSDKTAIGVWGIDDSPEPNLWLLPYFMWEKKPSDEWVEWLVDQAKAFDVFTAFFEKGQLDTAIGPFLERRMREKKVMFHIERFPTVGDKGKRAQSFRALCAVGRVRFPTFHPKWPAIKDHMLKFTGTGDDLEDDFADMCGLMGQGADKVLRAHVSKARSNVIEPRVGTLAWTRWASDSEKRMRNRPGRVVRAW